MKRRYPAAELRITLMAMSEADQRLRSDPKAPYYQAVDRTKVLHSVLKAPLWGARPLPRLLQRPWCLLCLHVRSSGCPGRTLNSTITAPEHFIRSFHHYKKELSHTIASSMPLSSSAQRGLGPYYTGSYGFCWRQWLKAAVVLSCYQLRATPNPRWFSPLVLTSSKPRMESAWLTGIVASR